MNGLNIGRKLTSRKFWMAVGGFVSMLLIAFKVAENNAQQVAEIIVAGGILMSYIFAEAWTDANNAQPEQPVTEEDLEEIIK